MIRSVLAGLLTASALIGTARAENETIPNTTAMVTWPKIFIQGAEKLIEPPDPESQRRYFNLAHCECAKANKTIETRPVTFGYQVKTTAMTAINRTADVWVGTDCTNDAVRDMMCRKTAVTLQVDSLFTSTTANVELSVFDIVNGKDTTGSCRTDVKDATIYLGIDTDGNAQYDFWSVKQVNKEASVVPGGIDTEPPPLPSDPIALPGEESIEILWGPPPGREDEIYKFQAMCQTVDEEAVTSEPPDPEYQTTQTLCQFTTVTGCVGGLPNSTCEAAETIQTCPNDCSVTATDLPVIEGDEPVPPPLGFLQLNPIFLCGETVEGTARTLRIEGLQNDVKYRVALLAIDQWGNVQGTYFNRTVTPKSVIDFWEDLHDRGSQVKGGCLLAEPGLFILLGVMLAACVTGRPRRRRMRALPAAALVLVLAPGTLRADDFTPYWEEPSGSETQDVEETVRWHLGIRLGPYIPDIDQQHPINPATGNGPYEDTFGDYYLEGKKKSRYLWHVLPMLDVDRILWRGFGQLGVGGSIGYMQKSAKAYANGTTPDDVMRERSSASEHTFRLVPLAATVVYRFTYLDEAYAIPVVPYVRGGLSYYGWWMKAPDGDLSKVCEDETAPPTNCPSYDKARGGSFGYQGSIGVALRAERIDGDAAMSMRNSGLYHAGFYAEFQYAKVDGFGSATKLSVGDATWFAGVDFEF